MCDERRRRRRRMEMEDVQIDKCRIKADGSGSVLL
jgi:hypothetical protein